MEEEEGALSLLFFATPLPRMSKPAAAESKKQLQIAEGVEAALKVRLRALHRPHLAALS